MNILAILLNLFLPENCVGCAQVGHKICPTCAQKLHILDFQECIYCNLLSSTGTHKLCSKYTSLNGHTAAFEYESLTRKIIIKSKHGENAYSVLNILLKHPHTNTLLEGLLKNFHPDIIIPVPQSKKIFSTRLIDHAEYISSYINSFFKTKLLTDCVIKTAGKKSQKQLNSTERFSTKSRFFIRGKYMNTKNSAIFGSKILLVDDVCTSGATLSIIAKLLKSAGAKEIQAFTLCKQLLYNYH